MIKFSKSKWIAIIIIIIIVFIIVVNNTITTTKLTTIIPTTIAMWDILNNIVHDIFIFLIKKVIKPIHVYIYNVN